MQREGDIDFLDLIVAYSKTMRMEYGMAMALAGFDEDIIIEVQQHVATNMIDWLNRN